MVRHTLLFATAAVLSSTAASSANNLEQESESYYYEVHGLLVVSPYDPHDPSTSISAPGTPKLASKGLRFSVVDTVTENDVTYYVIAFLHITREPKAFTDNKNTLVTKEDNAKYFFVSAAEFDRRVASGYIRKCYGWNPGFTYGANLTLPIKVRPRIEGRNRELATDVAVGGYVGGRFRFHRTKPYYVSLVATGGVVLLAIDQEDTPSAPDQKSATIAGLTWGVGIIVQLDRFQFGAMYGRDYAAGEAGNDWVYNGAGWFAVNIGLSFFGNSDDAPKDPTQ